MRINLQKKKFTKEILNRKLYLSCNAEQICSFPAERTTNGIQLIKKHVLRHTMNIGNGCEGFVRKSRKILPIKLSEIKRII